MVSSLHPISVMTRTDSNVCTVFHSFYLMSYSFSGAEINVVVRIPRDRSQVDVIESGLRSFLLKSIIQSAYDEVGGNFVVTTSNGARFYASFRCYDCRIFVAVSNLPLLSFCRDLFGLIEHEQASSIYPILQSLCEIPIFPSYGLRYDFELTKGVASIQFSAVDQVEDSDIDFTVLNFIPPIMLIQIWESIVLEKKILVVSSEDSIITTCCEYFRRMAIPLVIVNTYVPLLPIELISVVEAPFPYLLGANIQTIRSSEVDLSDTVIIDIDLRVVLNPINHSSNQPTPIPPKIVNKLLNEINRINLEINGKWLNRPSCRSHYLDDAGHFKVYTSTIHEQSIIERGTKILQVFVHENLSLMSARRCSVHAFYRRPEYLLDDTYIHSSKGPTRKVFTTMGFDCLAGVFSGFTQLYRERLEVDNVQHSIPCWIELDDLIFTAYEYADDLPLLYIPTTEIETVSPSVLEPEGYVFEVILRDQTMYRFTATDTECRRKWINAIENAAKKKTRKSFTGSTPMQDDAGYFNGSNKTNLKDNSPQVSVSASTASTPVGTPTFGAGSPLNHISHPVTPLHPYVTNHTSQIPTGQFFHTSPFSHHKDGFLSNDEQTNDLNSPFTASHNGKDSTDIHGRLSDEAVDTNKLNQLRNPVAVNNYSNYFDDGESQFRYVFNKTQMMTSLYTNMESVEYYQVMKELNIKTEQLVSENFETVMPKYLWTAGTIRGVLENIQRDNPNLNNGNNLSTGFDMDNFSSASADNCSVFSDTVPSSPPSTSRRGTSEGTNSRHTLHDMLSPSSAGPFVGSDDDGDSHLSITKVQQLEKQRMASLFWRKYSRDSVLHRRKYDPTNAEEQLISRIRNSASNSPVSKTDCEASTVEAVKQSHTTELHLALEKLAANDKDEAIAAEGMKAKTGTSAEIIGSNSEKTRKRSILGNFFSRSLNVSKLESKENVTPNDVDLLLEQRKKDLAIELEYQQRIKNKLVLIAASYRRCQAELSKTVIDHRIEALQPLAEDSTQSSTSGSNPSSHWSSRAKKIHVIVISLPSIISSVQRVNDSNDDDTKSNVSVSLSSPALDPSQARIRFIDNHQSISKEDNEQIAVEPKPLPESHRLYMPVDISSLANHSGLKHNVDNQLNGSQPPHPTIQTSNRPINESSLQWHNHIWKGLVGLNYNSSSTDMSTFSNELSRETNSSTLDSNKNFPLNELSNKFDSLGRRNQAWRKINNSLSPTDVKKLILNFLLNRLESAVTGNSSTIVVYQLLIGYLHQSLNSMREAIVSYADGGLLIDPIRIMQCIVLELHNFQEYSNASTASMKHCYDQEIPELKFFLWMYDLNPGLGLQTYRLLSEILYRKFMAKLSMDTYSMEKTLTLKSIRCFPGLDSSNLLRMGANGIASRLPMAGLNSPGFTWIHSDGKSECLNDVVICIALIHQTPPCELSIQLLSNIREILKEYSKTPLGRKLCRKSSTGFIKMKVTSSMIDQVTSTTAFRAFELQTCQLQKVDFKHFSMNQKLLFFINIYNVLTIHAILVKGSPGSNLNKRSNFIRIAKYNIGGLTFSLLDIEHGVLRNSSSKPMIFGPLTLSYQFSERDPRKSLALDEAKPNISFCLFNACASSPPLIVLKDLLNLDEEMLKYARKFVQCHVKLDPIQRSVELPGIMKVYWSDFGGNRSRVLNLIAQVSGPQFATELKPYMSTIEGVKPKIEFSSIDWSPLIIL